MPTGALPSGAVRRGLQSSRPQNCISTESLHHVLQTLNTSLLQRHPDPQNTSALPLDSSYLLHLKYNPPQSFIIAGKCAKDQKQRKEVVLVVIETESYRIDQAGLELLAPSDPPASASRSVGTIGTSHHTQPEEFLPGTLFLSIFSSTFSALHQKPQTGPAVLSIENPVSHAVQQSLSGRKH
ncbi:hypothetical protein AAY473_031001 [Plecturocebus cupreus]